MSKQRPSGHAASIRQRLLNLAKANKEESQFVLTRYALERLLYRLGQSPHRDRFVLKGAMLFQLWTGQIHRPTRDLDLLGRGQIDDATVTKLFRDICRHHVPDDAVDFEASAMIVEQIREDQEYHGLRLRIPCSLAGAQFPLQIDIGSGDAITPDPVKATYPTLLDDSPAPNLLTYPRETVVAEKLQAIVMLGIANSRIKDFYDLWILARTFPFGGPTLARAIAATFRRRSTDLPTQIPVALLPEFWESGAKWRAFLDRNKLDSEGTHVKEVIKLLHHFLMPPTNSLRAGSTFDFQWTPGGPWR